MTESHAAVADTPEDSNEGEAMALGAKGICIVERRCILSEIEKSKSLRDEMIRQDPSLATAASFMSTVCGGPTGKEMRTGVEGEKESQPQPEPKNVERQQLARITAAKSLLEGELRKERPSPEPTATFRAAERGNGTVVEPVQIEKEVSMTQSTTVLIGDVSERVSESRMDESSRSAKSATIATAVVESSNTEVTERMAEIDNEAKVVVSDDVAMSIGDSEEEESDGFSRSGSNSSRGESIPSRGSRKRRADDSPEREVRETGRREFPGLVSRSNAGCRIHVPVTERAGAMEIITQLMTANATGEDLEESRKDNATCAAEAVNATCDAGSLTTGKVGQSMNTNVTTVLATSVSTGTLSEERVVAPTNILRGPSEIVVGGVTKSVPEGDLVSRRPVVSEAGVVVRHDIERIEVPAHSASAVCVTTTVEYGVSESGRDHSVAADVVLPLLAAEGWARDAQMVEGIFRIMEGMEPPWVTLDVLEAATVRFPMIDRDMLRRTIMTVMMTQRRCVVRLTRAGLRRGARTDRDGNSFVELDLDFADRYSMSH